jgi:hypothetical protein
VNFERAALYVLAATAAATGAALASREPRHRPLAALLAFGIACDIAVAILPASLFGVRVAAAAAYPWAALAAVRRILEPRPRWRTSPSRLVPAFSLYIAAVFVFDLRDEQLAHAYAVAQLGIVVALGRCIWRWVTRSTSGRPSTWSERVAVAVACSEMLNVWAFLGIPGSWHLALTSYTLLWIVATAAHWRAYRCHPSTRASSSPAARSSRWRSR